MDSGQDVEPTALPCNDVFSVKQFLPFSLILAVLIVGVLSFLQRRVQKHAIDQRLPFLQGRFGIVIPMDAMGFSNRWSYGFAFGAISYDVIELLYEDHTLNVFPYWAKAIEYLIVAFEVGLAYFPFFACLSTPFRATGAVMGILYSVCWITVVGWDWFSCPMEEKWGLYHKVGYEWPRMLSFIFLLGCFIFQLVKAVRIQRRAEQEDSEELVHAHQREHVRRLLCRPAAYSKPLSWFQRHVYDWDPYFKFPNRVIGTAVVSLIVLYTVILTDLGLSTFWFNMLENRENSSHEKPEFWDVTSECWMVSLALGSLNSVAYICHVLVCYRKHLKRLWKGHKDFLPKKLQNPNSAVSVASIAKYSGWQIAFTMWGYLIVRFILFVAAMLIYYLLVLPIKSGEGLQLLTDLAPVLVALGLILGLLKLQEVLVQFFFLQDKISPTDKQKPLALNNRNAFNCSNYFFFFYNVVIGITSCFFRILVSLTLGTGLVSRIDRTIMQKGYETFDRGYRTWIGMIFADHYHNNPVMVCFCQLLLSHIEQIQHGSTYSVLNSAPCDSANSLFRKRWRLFYTLLKNPHLIPLRKHHLSAAVPLKLSSSPQADIVVRAWLMRSQAAPESMEMVTGQG